MFLYTHIHIHIDVTSFFVLNEIKSPKFQHCLGVYLSNVQECVGLHIHLSHLFSEFYLFVELGMTAPQAAGVIHSDFEKGFIRAETVSLISYWNVDVFILHDEVQG